MRENTLFYSPASPEKPRVISVSVDLVITCCFFANDNLTITADFFSAKQINMNNLGFSSEVSGIQLGSFSGRLRNYLLRRSQ